MLARQLIAEDDKQANDFYQEALDAGEEGVMAKGLDAPEITLVGVLQADNGLSIIVDDKCIDPFEYLKYIGVFLSID